MTATTEESPKSSDIIFVLGARDPEMDRIEEVLAENGLPFFHSLVDGEPVHAGNAYGAQVDASFVDASFPEDTNVIFVETSVEGIQPDTIIDHHRENDPGYGMPAEDSWEASSLGQLCTLLGIKGSHGDRVLAAMDHNFPAAIRGEVPNVTRDEVLELKIKEIAKSSHITTADVKHTIDKSNEQIDQAKKIDIGDNPVVDLRGNYLGEGPTCELLSMQVALASRDLVGLLSNRDKPGGPLKITLSGSATPELVELFKSNWGPSQGLVKIYGVPNRGYAGGYVPEQE